jgi:hypothetical protein
MLVFEAKLEGLKQQYDKLDETLRTARFVSIPRATGKRLRIPDILERVKNLISETACSSFL